jgi:hypothetical protein
MTHAESNRPGSRSYYHKPDHGDNNRDKSQWTISEDEEKECFENSFSMGWNQDYVSWGLHFKEEKVTHLGKAAQNESNGGTLLFIAKFVDGNKNNELWHGYPANPGGKKKQQDIPPENVLKDWLQKKYFRSASIISKIVRGHADRCRI